MPALWTRIGDRSRPEDAGEAVRVVETDTSGIVTEVRALATGKLTPNTGGARA